ncbi:sugar kinase [Treponema sp. TIM-1]|uniref:PfkB family carbohydrate kinase n=1 Tax=Treponema sp. TIM-1 TaxID=2898417 RepID=UPI00398125A5
MEPVKVVTFGEVMIRISALNNLKFRQSLPGQADLTFAGAEANVAASLSMLGCPTRFVSALPQHSIADACVGTLRNLNVDTSGILRVNQGRLGIFFVEKGANQRPSTVIYDREGASITLVSPAQYPWDAIFEGAQWFHLSGITPALSRLSAETALAAVQKAHEKGLTVSCDLNFRKKLWNWDASCSPRELARKIMGKILPYTDILIGNEEDAEDILGIKAGNTDVNSGKLDIDRYPSVAREIVRQYPRIRKVAITLRESISASHNNWGAMVYDTAGDFSVFAPLFDGQYAPYEIRDIVDRIGGGDAFAAGLIFGYLDSTLGKSDQDVLSFAEAASCLAHSIYGDFNYSTKEEVFALMKGDRSGRVKR